MNSATRVKICGLQRLCDVDIINKVRPDYAGVILAGGFRRSVDRKTAGEIRAMLDPSVLLVGVFADNDAEMIRDFFDAGIIDIAQLHGNESPDMIYSLKEQCAMPVWKAFRISEESDWDSIEESPADMVLLDAGQGCGEKFDWSLTENVKRSFMLAGGLTPQNVKEAIAQVHPFGVDTSSGVESDGWKDEKKITDFVHMVRENTGKEGDM